MADSWTVTQDFIVNAGGTSAVKLTQGSMNAATDSVQTFNSISLDTTAGVVDSGTQTIQMNDVNLTLIQTAGTTGSIQTANNISASSVTSGDQNVNTTGTITLALSQSATVDTDNEQALNRVKTPTVTTALTQDITTSSATLDMDQSSDATALLQAGNLIIADTLPASGVTQTIAVANAYLDQLDTTTSLQAGNALITGNDGGTIAQSFTVDAAEFLQDGTDGSIESGNFVGEEP
jgi:hypothetical protein